MRKIENQLIARTLGFWQDRSPQTLTREDAREIIENVSGFFRVLQKWDSGDQLSDAHRPHRGNIIAAKNPYDSAAIGPLHRIAKLIP